MYKQNGLSHVWIGFNWPQASDVTFDLHYTKFSLLSEHILWKILLCPKAHKKWLIVFMILRTNNF